MALWFWDASALVKRYLREVGSDSVNAMFAHLPRHVMLTTPWGYAETYSVLLRRLNSGVLDPPTFARAVAALQAEVVDDPAFGLLPIRDAVSFASPAMMRSHNLNSTDAAILTMLLEFVAALPPGSPVLVVIAADTRLLRAADAEGLRTLNPGDVDAADVPAFLAELS